MRVLALLPVLLVFSTDAVASQAMTNLADATAAWSCFAAYTNNSLEIISVDSAEWDANRRRDRLPFDMPHQFLVGPEELDRQRARAALSAVVTSMPVNIRTYYKNHHLIVPLFQRMIRRYRPGISNETKYVSAAAHPNVWTAKDFDIARLGAAARNLTSNDVPMMANLYPLYEEFKPAPIRRAEPLVDYPDPRPEVTYATPFGIAVVLRATENKRKFRFAATGWPFNDRNVNFMWMHKGGVWINSPQGRRDAFPLEKGYGEICIDWAGAIRRDVYVFARYGTDPWGPPSIISFYRIPNEKRQYDRDGRIQSMEYVPVTDAIQQLYQNKPWKDVFTRNSLGHIIGFLRFRSGQQKDEAFSILGERVLETHAGDIPKVTAKVRYFTRTDDPTTLDYEVTEERTNHPQRPVTLRDRGEYPTAKPRRK